MKIGIYAHNRHELDSMASYINNRAVDAEIDTSCLADGEAPGDMELFIKDKELIINLVSIKGTYPERYRDLSAKYQIDLCKAENLMKLISCYELLPRLNLLAKAVQNSSPNAVIINAGEPVDIITLYLYKVYGIESYGISRKAKGLVDYLLNRLNLDDYLGKVGYKLAGIENSLWLYEIKSGDVDIYPEIREQVKALELAVKRNDLTRDPLRSLQFFGYYHSYDTPPQGVEDAVADVISALSSREERVYLSAVNHGSIYGLDGEACVELPFKFQDGKALREQVELPLQCTLAMTDAASAVSLAVKSLQTGSRDIFNRTLKLDPYLSSILTLDELQGLADDLLAVEQSLSNNLKQELK